MAVVRIFLVHCPLTMQNKLLAQLLATAHLTANSVFLLTPVSVPEPGLLFRVGAIALLAAHLGNREKAN